MKQLFLFLIAISIFACNDSSADKAKIQELESQLVTATEALATSTEKQPGLIHSVFFWLNEGISEADEAAFLEGVNSLRSISTIQSCYVGPPAPTEARDVVDNSYSYALIVHFEDVAGQDAYQIDPVHLKFVEDHKDKWTKVVVYDNTLLE